LKKAGFVTTLFQQKFSPSPHIQKKVSVVTSQATWVYQNQRGEGTGRRRGRRFIASTTHQLLHTRCQHFAMGGIASRVSGGGEEQATAFR
jgi:hypothetical protein